LGRFIVNGSCVLKIKALKQTKNFIIIFNKNKGAKIKTVLEKIISVELSE